MENKHLSKILEVFSKYRTPYILKEQQKEYDSLIDCINKNEMLRGLRENKGIMTLVEKPGISLRIDQDLGIVLVNRSYCGQIPTDVREIATGAIIQQEFPDLTPQELSKDVANYIAKNM